MVFLDRLVERKYCFTHEACPRFNWKEDALEFCIVLILIIAFPLESHVNLSVYSQELSEHFRILNVVDLEIVESEKLLIISLIFKLHQIN